MAADTKTEMVSFLKKWSPVENAFIDDFFGQVDPTAPDDEHVVSLDSAAKWLHVKKYNLMQTLKMSYTHGADFTVGKPSVRLTGRGKNTRREVMLTTDCFKMLCMQSKSPQAGRVRDYFIAVEKTLFRYRSDIMENMQRRITQLELNQRSSKTVPTGGLIYVIRSGSTRVKLGRTGDLAKRLLSHGSALEILHVYKTDNMADVEACAKAVLTKFRYRKYKEIYEADLDVIKRAIEGCGKLCSKVQRRSKSGNVDGGGARSGTFAIFVKED
jgi:hypothetical protein